MMSLGPEFHDLASRPVLITGLILDPRRCTCPRSRQGEGCCGGEWWQVPPNCITWVAGGRVLWEGVVGGAPHLYHVGCAGKGAVGGSGGMCPHLYHDGLQGGLVCEGGSEWVPSPVS